MTILVTLIIQEFFCCLGVWGIKKRPPRYSKDWHRDPVPLLRPKPLRAIAEAHLCHRSDAPLWEAHRTYWHRVY